MAARCQPGPPPRRPAPATPGRPWVAAAAGRWARRRRLRWRPMTPPTWAAMRSLARGGQERDRGLWGLAGSPASAKSDGLRWAPGPCTCPRTIAAGPPCPRTRAAVATFATFAPAAPASAALLGEGEPHAAAAASAAAVLRGTIATAADRGCSSTEAEPARATPPACPGAAGGCPAAAVAAAACCAAPPAPCPTGLIVSRGLKVLVAPMAMNRAGSSPAATSSFVRQSASSAAAAQ